MAPLLRYVSDEPVAWFDLVILPEMSCLCDHKSKL